MKSNFMKAASVIALSAKAVEGLLQLAPKNRVSEGRTYDAVIATCAEKAKASTIHNPQCDRLLGTLLDGIPGL
jgi:hypothetical protein